MKRCHIVISAVTEALEEALRGPGVAVPWRQQRGPAGAGRCGSVEPVHCRGAVVFHVPGPEIFSLQHTERNTVFSSFIILGRISEFKSFSFTG